MSNEDKTYVKLYRSIEKWEWYTDVNTTKLWIHILIKANHKPNKWRGRTIKRGQFISSYSKLAKETGLSVKSVRVALNHLKTTNEVAYEGAQQYSLITVIKWSDYQSKEDSQGTDRGKSKGNQRAHEGQARGKRGATNKNEKNDKNDKKKDIGDFVEFSNNNQELLDALLMFDQMRTAIKKPLTAGAKKLLISKLTKMQSEGEDIIECLKTSVMNSWLSVYPAKSNRTPRRVESAEILNHQLYQPEINLSADEVEEIAKRFKSIGKN